MRTLTAAEQLNQECVHYAGAAFEEKIGSSNSSPADSLRDGLFTASQMLLGASNKASRRVIIFTTAEDPCPDDSDGK